MATTIIPNVINVSPPIITFSNNAGGAFISNNCNLQISFSFIPTNVANADILVTLSLALPVFFCFPNNQSVVSFTLKNVTNNSSVTKTVNIKLKTSFNGSPILKLFINAKDVHSNDQGQTTSIVCNYRII